MSTLCIFNVVYMPNERKNKPKMGRPVLEDACRNMIQVRIPDSLHERILEEAELEGVSRAEMLRILLVEALDARKRKRARKKS